MKVIKYNGKTDDDSLLRLANKALQEFFSVFGDVYELVAETKSWASPGVSWAPNESIIKVKLLNITGTFRGYQVSVGILFAVCEDEGEELIPILIKVLHNGRQKEFRIISSP